MEKAHFSKITKQTDAINNECSCLYVLANALEIVGNNKLSDKLLSIANKLSKSTNEITDILILN